MVKLTKAMADAAIEDGANVKTKRKMPKRPPKVEVAETAIPIPEPAPLPPAPDRGPELEALRAEIVALKQALSDARSSSETRSQELTALLNSMNCDRPMRLKPVRDMDRESPTYLLVSYYDFVPVEYRKLDS